MENKKQFNHQRIYSDNSGAIPSYQKKLTNYNTPANYSPCTNKNQINSRNNNTNFPNNNLNINNNNNNNSNHNRDSNFSNLNSKNNLNKLAGKFYSKNQNIISLEQVDSSFAAINNLKTTREKNKIDYKEIINLDKNNNANYDNFNTKKHNKSNDSANKKNTQNSNFDTNKLTSANAIFNSNYNHVVREREKDKRKSKDTRNSSSTNSNNSFSQNRNSNLNEFTNSTNKNKNIKNKNKNENETLYKNAYAYNHKKNNMEANKNFFNISEGVFIQKPSEYAAASENSNSNKTPFKNQVDLGSSNSSLNKSNRRNQHIIAINSPFIDNKNTINSLNNNEDENFYGEQYKNYAASDKNQKQMSNENLLEHADSLNFDKKIINDNKNKKEKNNNLILDSEIYQTDVNIINNINPITYAKIISPKASSLSNVLKITNITGNANFANYNNNNYASKNNFISSNSLNTNKINHKNTNNKGSNLNNNYDLVKNDQEKTPYSKQKSSNNSIQENFVYNKILTSNNNNNNNKSKNNQVIKSTNKTYANNFYAENNKNNLNKENYFSPNFIEDENNSRNLISNFKTGNNSKNTLNTYIKKKSVHKSSDFSTNKNNKMSLNSVANTNNNYKIQSGNSKGKHVNYQFANNLKSINTNNNYEIINNNVNNRESSSSNNKLNLINFNQSKSPNAKNSLNLNLISKASKSSKNEVSKASAAAAPVASNIDIAKINFKNLIGGIRDRNNILISSGSSNNTRSSLNKQNKNSNNNFAKANNITDITINSNSNNNNYFNNNNINNNSNSNYTNNNNNKDLATISSKQNNNANSSYANITFTHNFTNFQNNLSNNQLAKSSIQHSISGSIPAAQSSIPSNNAQTAYSNSYMNKRHNMIKNSKNFYQEKLISSNFGEREKIGRIIDESLKIQKQGSSLSSNRDSGSNANLNFAEQLQLQQQKSSDFNATGGSQMNRINSENFVVNKINSFPINYFQKASLNENNVNKEATATAAAIAEENLVINVNNVNVNNERNEDYSYNNIYNYNQNNNFYKDNINDNNNNNNNYFESNRNRKDEENLTTRYSNRINPLLNLHTKNMDLNTKSLAESSDFEKTKKASFLNKDADSRLFNNLIIKNNNKINPKEKHSTDIINIKELKVDNEIEEETSFFMGAYPEADRTNTLASNADLNNETIRYNYKNDIFKISNNFGLASESNVQVPRATFYNYEELKKTEIDLQKQSNDNLIRSNIYSNNNHKNYNKNYNNNKNIKQQQQQVDEIPISNSPNLTNDITNNNKLKINLLNKNNSNSKIVSEIYNSLKNQNAAAMIETIDTNKTPNIESFLRSKNILLQNQNKINNNIIVSNKDLKKSEFKEEMKKINLSKNINFNDSHIIYTGNNDSKNTNIIIGNKSNTTANYANAAVENENENLNLNARNQINKISSNKNLNEINSLQKNSNKLLISENNENSRSDTRNSLNLHLLKSSLAANHQNLFELSNLNENNNNNKVKANNNNNVNNNGSTIKFNYGYNHSINILINSNNRGSLGIESFKKVSSFNENLDSGIIYSSKIPIKNKKIEMKNYKNFNNSKRLDNDNNNANNNNKASNKSKNNYNYYKSGAPKNFNNANNKTEEIGNMSFSNENLLTTNSNCINNILMQETFDFHNQRLSDQNKHTTNAYSNLISEANEKNPFKKFDSNNNIVDNKNNNLYKDQNEIILNSNKNIEKKIIPERSDYDNDNHIIRNSQSNYKVNNNNNNKNENIQIIINNNISYYNSNNINYPINASEDINLIEKTQNNSYNINNMNKRNNQEFKFNLSEKSSNSNNDNKDIKPFISRNEIKEENENETSIENLDKIPMRISELITNEIPFKKAENKNLIENELVTSNELKAKNFEFYKNKFSESDYKNFETEKIINQDLGIDYAISPLNDFNLRNSNKGKSNFEYYIENKFKNENSNPLSEIKDKKVIGELNEFNYEEKVVQNNFSNKMNLFEFDSLYQNTETSSFKNLNSDVNNRNNNNINKQRNNLLVIGIDSSKKVNNKDKENKENKDNINMIKISNSNLDELKAEADKIFSKSSSDYIQDKINNLEKLNNDIQNRYSISSYVNKTYNNNINNENDLEKIYYYPNDIPNNISPLNKTNKENITSNPFVDKNSENKIFQKEEKVFINENNNNYINLALSRDLSEKLRKQPSANSSNSIILFSNKNSAYNLNEEAMISKDNINMSNPTLNIIKKISSFNIGNELFEENNSANFSENNNNNNNLDNNNRLSINLTIANNEKSSIISDNNNYKEILVKSNNNSNYNASLTPISERQNFNSTITNYIEEKLRSKVSNGSLSSTKNNNLQNKTANRNHYYEKSDEDCTLSEDEKANITNVPIFKSKRFTSFNIQNNSNVDLRFEKLDQLVSAGVNKNNNNISSSNNNTNSTNNFSNNNNNNSTKENNNLCFSSSNNFFRFSKCLTDSFFKSLFINSTKTKTEICNFLNLKDLINLSYVDKILHKELKEKIHSTVKNMIINENNFLLRLKIWRSIFKHSKISLSENIKQTYIEYLNDQKSKYLEDILKDINRTLPEDQTFRTGKINNLKLKNILIAYSNYNPKIGYAQGLNFIVASAILVLSDEEQVFLFIDALLKKFKFNQIMGLRNSQVRKHLDSIQVYLEKYVPKLCVFFSRNGLTHEFFSTNWVITVFANVVGHSVLFKIWDFFVIFGWKFFDAFLISVLMKFENKIMAYDANYLSVSLKALMKSVEFDAAFEAVVDKAFEIMRFENFKELYFEEEDY